MSEQTTVGLHPKRSRLEALKAIEGGWFDSAGSLAINGDWRSFTRELQAIARDALAATDETAELRAALEGTLNLIRRAQERLSAHLSPESSGDDHECMNALLEMFDGPEQRRIEGAARAALSNSSAQS